MDLVMHPKTAQQFKDLTLHPPSALLIIGPGGAGKATLARAYLKGILNIDSLSKYPYAREIVPEKQSITIDSIRELKNFLSLKTTGETDIRRGVIIHEAQFLSVPAQAALLKTLEEPPADTLLILTASDAILLPSTILSRLSQMTIFTLPKSLAQEASKAQPTPLSDFQWAYNVSDGWPGLFFTLITDDKEHELHQALKDAKQLLLASPYERLLGVEKLSKNPAQVNLLLDALQRLATAGLRQAMRLADANKARQFRQLTTLVLSSKEAIKKKASTKLVLQHLFLHL